MAQLLDQFGTPIRRTELEQPVAGPTVTGVRPVISGHPAEALTPRRLAFIHRDAAEGEPLAYLELAEDIEERDLHYAGVMATRKRSVAQLPITVAAASDAADHKKHAEFVQSWINDGVLAASLFDMLDAIGKGFSVLELNWRMHLGHLCPRDFEYRPQRWFKFDPTDGETVVLRDAAAGETLPAHKFAIHRHKSKSGLTIRSGLARLASWAWMAKSFTMKDWSIFVQNFGAPIRIGKYGRNATEQEKDVLWRAVANIAGDVAAIIPSDMIIDFQEVGAKSASTDLYERRADWLDRQVSKAVLGQTTTTDAVSGGHAVSREHRLVQEDIERSDAISLTRTVNHQIIANMVAFNFGPQDHYPRVSIGRPDEVPLEEFASAFDKLGRQGLKAPAAWVRGRLGIPEPQKDEETIGGRPAAPETGGDDHQGGTGERPSPHAFGWLVASRHTRADAEAFADRLTGRLERDAAGALAGLSDQIRKALEKATDLRDAARRLAALELAPDELVEAMARGMALAHLAGQAALIDELPKRK